VLAARATGSLWVGSTRPVNGRRARSGGVGIATAGGGGTAPPGNVGTAPAGGVGIGRGLACPTRCSGSGSRDPSVGLDGDSGPGGDDPAGDDPGGGGPVGSPAAAGVAGSVSRSVTGPMLPYRAV